MRNKSFFRRCYLLIIVFVVFLLGLFFISKDAKECIIFSLAKENLGFPVAIFLNHDANRAMFIGNYYFNGVIGGGEYNTARAFKAFKKAVLINPKILWGHYQLARIYFVNGDFNAALDEINKELTANPENLRSLYVRGLIYGYRGFIGDPEKSEADFQRFVKWAPKEWAGYNDLAWILSKRGKYREAEEIVNLAFKEVEGAEKNPWLWNALGLAEINLGKRAKARISFEKAKKFAENLTLSEWRKAYPGNAPEYAQFGLSTFLNTVEINMEKSNK